MNDQPKETLDQMCERWLKESTDVMGEGSYPPALAVSEALNTCSRELRTHLIAVRSGPLVEKLRTLTVWTV